MVDINVDWKIIEHVIKKLRDEDWSVKFENDSDYCELEEIAEDGVDADDEIKKDVEYFRLMGKDIVKSTRILLEPPDNSIQFPIVIYYGEKLDNYKNEIPEMYINHVLELIEKVKKE